MANVKKYNNLEVEEFKNMTEFMNLLNERPTSSGYSESSMAEGRSWTGTKSWEEANQLMSTGYAKGLEDMMTFTKVKVTRERKKRVYDVTGEDVDLELFMQRVPECMIDKKSVKKPAKVMTIYYNPACVGDLSTSDFAMAGSRLLSLVRAIEARKIRTKLVVIETGGFFSKNVGMCVTLKEAAQPMNALKMSYFFTHPSFARRHCFRWYETSPVTKTLGGYGCVTSRKVVMNSGLVKNNDLYFGIHDLLKLDTEEAMLKAANL